MLSPVQKKIATIKNATEPKNISELKSFLELLNNYHRYFKNFKKLNQLLRKQVKWQCTEKEQTAIRSAKSILSDTKIIYIMILRYQCN